MTNPRFEFLKAKELDDWSLAIPKVVGGAPWVVGFQWQEASTKKCNNEDHHVVNDGLKWVCIDCRESGTAYEWS